MLLQIALKRIMRPMIISSFIFLAGGLQAMAGGVSFSIYLNNKLLFTEKQYRELSQGIKYLKLDEKNINDVLVIYIRQCGKPGKNRSIALKELNNEILGRWAFADEGGEGKMTIPVKEILKLKKRHANSKVALYYYGADFVPDGFLLASIGSPAQNSLKDAKDVGFFWDLLPGGLLVASLAGIFVIRRK